MREYLIDDTHQETYESGMMFLTLLAFPEANQDDAVMTERHASLCHLFLVEKTQNDPVWSYTPQLLKPIYLFRTEKQIKRDLRVFDRRMRDRMVAAKMAIAYLQEVLTGKLPKLPQHITDLSLNQLSELVIPDIGYSEANNVESRIWRQSLPVIHLATAYVLATTASPENQAERTYLNNIFKNAADFKKMILSAQEHSAMLLSSKKISISPDKLVRLVFQNK